LEGGVKGDGGERCIGLSNGMRGMCCAVRVSI
jgi:hypothetical protein